jgi:hypothetical protein
MTGKRKNADGVHEMQTKIVAILSLVSIGLGFLGGYLIWGPRAEQATEFERLAVELEEDLERSRELVERANAETAALRERQREITTVVDRAGRELADAIGNAQSVNDLLREAIAVVERLEAVTRDGDIRPGSTAPP